MYNLFITTVLKISMLLMALRCNGIKISIRCTWFSWYLFSAVCLPVTMHIWHSLYLAWHLAPSPLPLPPGCTSWLSQTGCMQLCSYHTKQILARTFYQPHKNRCRKSFNSIFKFAEALTLQTWNNEWTWGLKEGCDCAFSLQLELTVTVSS